MTTRVFGKVALLVGGTLLAACANSPLGRSEEAIRLEVLKAAPPGTSKDRVRSELTQSARLEEGSVSPSISNYPTESPVGDSFFRVHLGEYGALMKTDVVAIYYFDANDRLLDVRIVKYREGT